MISKIIGALARAVLISITLAIPSLWIPTYASDTSHLTLAFALSAGAFVFFEYLYDTPSTLEFTTAPPYNRIRFTWFLIVVVFTAGVFRMVSFGHVPTGPLSAIATILGHVLNIPYSPVQLISIMLPQNLTPEFKEAMLMTAGFGYVGSLITCGIFYLVIRFTNWPKSDLGFNVWKNLPLLDPTSGKDIVFRLVRDARVNVSLGIIAPFAIPAIVKIIFIYTGIGLFMNPQTLVWIMVAWTVIPTSLIMRGTAMMRVANLISEKRQADNHEQVLQLA